MCFPVSPETVLIDGIKSDFRETLLQKRIQKSKAMFSEKNQMKVLKLIQLTTVANVAQAQDQMSPAAKALAAGCDLDEHSTQGAHFEFLFILFSTKLAKK